MAFYYNAIFFDRGSKAYKYRTIKNMERFESYIMGKFDVVYINYYDRKTRKFLFRKYMNAPQQSPVNELNYTANEQ